MKLGPVQSLTLCAALLMTACTPACSSPSGCCPGGTGGSPADLKSVAQPSLAFSDEFNSLNVWDGHAGTWDTSYSWQNKPNGSTLPNEGEWYIRHEFAPTSHIRPWVIDDGVLNIVAAETDPSIREFTEGHAYTSGVLTSLHSYSRQFGYFEMRAKVPAGQGLWPAFWLVPADGTSSHEIDVMEVVGQDTSKLHTTFHTFKPKHVQQTKVSRVSDMSKAFHTYGVNWQCDKISWYFDRKLVHQVKTPPELHKPMFMIIDLAVGGPMPGPAGPTTPLPANLAIDYVRVYSTLPKGKPGPTP